MPDWFNQLGLMGWPLALCSLTSLAVGLERAVFFIDRWRKRSGVYRELVDSLKQYESHPKALRDEISSLLLEELQTKYHSGLKLLRMIGTISPMLGLLGTVLGIISAFQKIAAHVGPVSPSLIADGLWEAMLTTAFGLMIALPSLLLAHFFRSLAEKLLDKFCIDLNRLSLSFETGSEIK